MGPECSGPGSQYATERKQDFYVNYAANDHYMSASMALTYAYWNRVFGGDPSVIGQVLDLTVKQAEITGGADFSSSDPTSVRPSRGRAPRSWKKFAVSSVLAGARRFAFDPFRLEQPFPFEAREQRVSSPRCRTRSADSRCRMITMSVAPFRRHRQQHRQFQRPASKLLLPAGLGHGVIPCVARYRV